MPMRFLALLALIVIIGMEAACASRRPHDAEEIGAERRDAVSVADSLATARAVEAFVTDSFFRAISRFDHASVARLLTPTFEQGQDGSRLSGEQFINVVRSLPESTAGLAYQPSSFRTQVRGAVAWTSYQNRITFTPKQGALTASEVFETVVLVRSAEGQWRIDRRYATALRPVR